MVDPPDIWWWISFLDHRRNFAGACLVRGEDSRAALTRAHLLGLNPGGEARIGGPLTGDLVRESTGPEAREVFHATVEEVIAAHGEVDRWDD